jgi:hypothetical protein
MGEGGHALAGPGEGSVRTGFGGTVELRPFGRGHTRTVPLFGVPRLRGPCTRLRQSRLKAELQAAFCRGPGGAAKLRVSEGASLEGGLRKWSLVGRASTRTGLLPIRHWLRPAGGLAPPIAVEPSHNRRGGSMPVVFGRNRLGPCRVHLEGLFHF